MDGSTHTRRHAHVRGRVRDFEHVHYTYVPRLVAFMLIIVGVMHKNRRG